MPSFCHLCGFENHFGMRFCGNCGTRLLETSNLLPEIPTSIAVSARNQEEFCWGGPANGVIAPDWNEAKGERRNITVLFVDMCRYTGLAETLENDELFDLIQRFIEVLSGVVYRYEGMVDKVMGDGLMAFFGAPISHENNAERAVRAARDMLSSLQLINEEWHDRLANDLDIHVGIHSGSVTLGNIGGNQPLHYTAVGDTVNLARRLQEIAAPGEILISQRVHDTTRAYFEFDPVSGLRLKGIKHPVNAFRVLGERGQPGSLRGLEGFQASMVGREHALRQVLDGIQDSIVHRKGRFILVGGEAGIGKSRLTSETRARINPVSMNVIEGHSLTYRRAISYWLFKSAFLNYLTLAGHSSTHSIRTRLEEEAQRLLGSRSAQILPFLEELLKIEQSDVVDHPYSSFLSPEQRRQQIFLAVKEFLEAAAHQKPLLLILEDLHWADDASLDLLAFLSTVIQGAPLIVYGTSRPIQSERAKGTFDLMRSQLEDRFLELSLENLTIEESRILFSELLPNSRVPPDIARRILLQADGNPFYLEEIIRMLIDNHMLHLKNGRWEVVAGSSLEEIGVPDNVQDLIQARFDRLEPIQKKVLQIASLIGRQFDQRLLAAVLQPMEERTLRVILSAMVEKSFLIYDSKSRDGEFHFRHVLTSDTIYRTLVRREKEEWHGRIGEALESLTGSRIDEQVEQLAGHYLRSNRFEQALYYSILAGQKAARDYANEQARWYFEEARRLLDITAHSADQALEVWMGLGDVAVFTGDYCGARDCFQKALQIGMGAQVSTLRWNSPVIKMKIGTTYARQGDLELALSTMWEAYHNSSDSLDNPVGLEKAELLNEIGWVNFLKGDIQQARQCLLEGLGLVESSERFDVLASIYNRLGAVAYQGRAYQESTEYVRESLLLREKIGDLAGVARLYNNLGLLGLVQGYLREAEENFLKSFDILKKLGDAEGIALTAINVGLMKCERGEFVQAAEFLDRGFQAASQIGHRFYISLAKMYTGRLKSMLGEYNQAAQALKESIVIFEEIGAKDNIVDAYYYLGENDLLRDNVDGALKSVTLISALITANQELHTAPGVQYGRVIRLRGVIHRRRMEFEEASKLIRASAAVFEESNEQLELARSLFELGRLAELGGNLRTAREYYTRAQTLFSLLGADLDLRRLSSVRKPGAK